MSGATGTGPAPLNGADVVVSRRVTRLDDVVTWREVAEVQTNAVGAWSVPVVDGDCRVHFTGDNWVDEYYDDAATEQDAEVVTVAGASRPGIDAELSPGGTITGTVTDAATSGPLVDAEVYAFMPNGDGDQFAFTDASGGFTLSGLAPGEWVVQYDADGHIGEYFDDQPTQATADRITVTTGSATTADAALATATQVSGTVTGTAGAPLDFVGVDIHRVLDSGDVDYFYEWAFTGNDGTWSAELPPAATWWSSTPTATTSASGSTVRPARPPRPRWSSAPPRSPASTPSCSRAAPSPAPSPVPAACRRRTPTSRSSGRTRPASSRRSGRASPTRPGATGPTRSRRGATRSGSRPSTARCCPSTTSTRRTWRPRTPSGWPWA